MTTAVEAMLGRHRAVSIVALIILTGLAWAWLLSGASMAMDPIISFSPLATDGIPQSATPMDSAMNVDSAWAAERFAVTLSMWWVMMIAMMLPSAAPTILLYGRAASHGKPAVRPDTEFFLAGYLVAWGGYSLIATVLHLLLERIVWLAPMTMASGSRWLSGGILITAGIYQLGPLKDMCLRHCRNPASFLSRNYRSGRIGALKMGLLHGTYCVGCCWLLMALLFVGGVMNLAWIALLTVIVATEKLLPHGRLIGIAMGLAIIVWGSAMLLE